MITAYPLHHEIVVTIAALPEAAFAYLDDFRKLSAHMERSSPMLVGSKMAITIDALGGRSVGSTVRMTGNVLGMRLSLEEVVTERTSPFTKTWQTVDSDLRVIGPYRLGFVLSPLGRGSSLRVFIDYDLPPKRLFRWLGKVFGGTYARWCTTRMADDAVAYFGALR